MPNGGPLKAKAIKARLSASAVAKADAPRGHWGFPVIAIGASAGGLDAARKLVGGLPAGNGMAFILVQHLDPTHESMMVELLAAHTPMTVLQATDGLRIESDHLYVIPPGTYLSIADGALRLSQPQARHGARLPFDFLLRSLATELGDRAIGIVLSGTGADGSQGLKAVKEQGGLVIAQEPEDAGFDGMPRNAIMTGAVDLVLPVAEIPEALLRYQRRMTLVRAENGRPSHKKAQDWLPRIIDLLRTSTPHDFTSYKPGTLQRRIERRMAMAAIDADGMERYLNALRGDPRELELLAKDLLINVTSFFRDPKVFDLLAEKIVADILRNRSPEHALRIWIAGCSTGEEAYSLAMLFCERIAAEDPAAKLQVFASDTDADAVAIAREGLYPESIEADVSPQRLAQFFVKEGQSYRVVPALRAMVVFTVQDVLGDPPFSRLDMVSCRNLLIYLRPEAQAKVISLFHFALRGGGILLLGNSETAGSVDGHFEVISKTDRIFRRIGRSRPVAFGPLIGAGDGTRPSLRPGQVQAPSRLAVLAEACRQLVMDSYAPASVLINLEHECLYFLGPTDRYLRIARGLPTHDLLAMVPEDMRIKLRAAILRARQEKARIVIAGGRTNHDRGPGSFSIAVQPAAVEGEELFLVCFIDDPQHDREQRHPAAPRDALQIAELEKELDATKSELQGALRNWSMPTCLA